MNLQQVLSRLRGFCLNKGLREVTVQHKKSILAACEDPGTISTYTSQGLLWALPQTGQMHLEHIMLDNPHDNGYFTITTSYRDEPNPEPGRHESVFIMFEFEIGGGIEELIKFEKDMLNDLGYTKINTLKYQSAQKVYNCIDIGSAEEKMIEKDFGTCVMLKDFPLTSNPYWNMSGNDEYSNKIDVIMHGMETIGSAERSCDPDYMMERFLTQSDGEYSKLLYDKFGEERVNQELEVYLNKKFFPRSGGGIGVSRLMRSLQLK